jgi:hypothetical protein
LEVSGSNHGKDGWLFWDELKRYLRRTQRILSSHVLVTLGWNPEAVRACEPDDEIIEFDDRNSSRRGRSESTAVWGRWLGREEEAYRRAYAVVSQLDRAEFQRIAGDEHSGYLCGVEDRYRRMTDPELPDRLRRNPELEVHQDGNGLLLLTAYSSLDPVRVRREIYASLEAFDGRRRWQEVVTSISREHGVTVGHALLAALYQQRILIEPNAATDQPPNRGVPTTPA